jgi:hypothetical protein
MSIMDMSGSWPFRGENLTPLFILLERAEAMLLAHGPACSDAIVRQIETAVRNGEDSQRVRELDHILQLVEFRERGVHAKPDGDDRGRTFPAWPDDDTGR